MNAVEVNGLNKVYGKVVALAGVDPTVTPGTNTTCFPSSP